MYVKLGACMLLIFQVGGTGGGISVKNHPEYIVMAPSGVQKERMQPDDIFVLDARGEVCTCLCICIRMCKPAYRQHAAAGLACSSVCLVCLCQGSILCERWFRWTMEMVLCTRVDTAKAWCIGCYASCAVKFMPHYKWPLYNVCITCCVLHTLS